MCSSDGAKVAILPTVDAKELGPKVDDDLGAATQSELLIHGRLSLRAEDNELLQLVERVLIIESDLNCAVHTQEAVDVANSPEVDDPSPEHILSFSVFQSPQVRPFSAS